MIKSLPEILVGTFVVFITTFLGAYYGFAPENMVANVTLELLFFRLVYVGIHFMFTWKRRRYRA
ncbi:hypothetical protein LQZ24_01425 [Fructobacillus sp. M1-13]|uniref:Uncharacterized protein n=1 Tax=Fructobacillus papyriferae TaxID=2713171 RepID=A0ABS5QNK5_9LACO|nr:hypothetical protein [Fructobacillus papyriferae]MBS9334698.1 hypothetical protein [Fructobacillus papyriferae]MCD2158688.1 hypothetical protein [Fructobacillus papyriferae]